MHQGSMLCTSFTKSGYLVSEKLFLQHVSRKQRNNFRFVVDVQCTGNVALRVPRLDIPLVCLHQTQVSNSYILSCYLNIYFAYFCVGIDLVENSHNVIYNISNIHDISQTIRSEALIFVFFI